MLFTVTFYLFLNKFFMFYLIWRMPVSNKKLYVFFLTKILNGCPVEVKTMIKAMGGTCCSHPCTGQGSNITVYVLTFKSKQEWFIYV